MISVTVCRGCCCGTARKHPETDHEGQLRQLAEVGVRVRVVADCLGPCEHSNVMVVHPSSDQRRKGARVVWLGGVLDSRLVVHIGRWAAQGGPGAAAIPEAVRPLVIARPTRPPRTPAAPAVPSGLGWPGLTDLTDVAGLTDQAFAASGMAAQGAVSGIAAEVVA